MPKAPRKRPPKPPFKPVNSFLCPCTQDRSFTQAEMQAHLAEVHKIPKGTKGTKKMTCHLDAPEAFYSDYEWKIGDLTFHQHTANPRNKDSMMAWGV